MFYPKISRRPEYVRNAEGKYFPYSRYRNEVAEDCVFRCVYCDSHQDILGGLEAMEMDHFRPWRKKFPDGEQKFLHLRDEPLNLVHSCSICNGFKWSHWPTEDPDKSYDHEKGWIHPFDDLRDHFFKIDDDGTLSPIIPPALYQIKQLRLNRPLLKRQREFRILISNIEKYNKPMWEKERSLDPNGSAGKIAIAALALLECVSSVLHPT